MKFMSDNYDYQIKAKGEVRLMLNLGCGNNYHPDWINVDFVAAGDDVISYDLTKGIPFSSEVFDVVYHSHVLEHFTAQQGNFLIGECFRVLKPKGILRIAVPDLEGIVRNYVKFLEDALNSEKGALGKYQWMKIELYDQTIRNTPGGEYQNFLLQADAELQQFAQNRLGKEIEAIQLTKHVSFFERLKRKSFAAFITFLNIKITKFFIYLLGGQRFVRAFEIGLFRLSGEIHQCMYDRLSLTHLLKANQFEQIKVMSAFESGISDFERYGLDAPDGVIRKPDSIFIEARKK
jgi:predicted SAM-dependent methyltransferase